MDIIFLLIFLGISVREFLSLRTKKSLAPLIRAQLSMSRNLSVMIMLIVSFILLRTEAVSVILILKILSVVLAIALTYFNYDGISTDGIFFVGSLCTWDTITFCQALDLGNRIKLVFKTKIQLSDIYFDKKNLREIEKIIKEHVVNTEEINVH